MERMTLEEAVVLTVTLFEQPMLPDEIFGCVVIGQKGIEQVSG